MVKLLLVVFFVTLGLPARGQPDLTKRVEELERRMRQIDPAFTPPSADLAARIAALEARMEQALAKREEPPPTPQPAAPVAPLTPVSVTSTVRLEEDEGRRLPVAGYMDFHFNKEIGAPGTLDFHRFVLLFGHSFSNRIKFWSELEVEHAFVEGREEKGELELEQAYLDFLLTPRFNLRAGMVLAPVGIINERHEPPSFNGVERPLVETFIVPTTWFDAGVGATGDLGRGFRYRAYMMGTLDATGFSAEEGIREGRQKGFQTSFRNPATAARLEYNGVRRLTLGTSLFTGLTGFNLPTVNPRTTVMTVDGRYSWRQVDLRGLFANVNISRAAELNRALENETGTNPNIARRLMGWYLEPAYHVLRRQRRHDLIVFSRYEKFNTQHRMPAGYLPLEQFNRSAWFIGTTYKPHADVAFKFDYAFHGNASSVVRAVNTFNLGLGWWF